ncbi:hypothetical protein WICPIJ_001388 [Wickerhamomyces pijperi]|uniref:Uncharacterized protein n=1 Tax=Wickerhamomyces pijperi TaxID=599730 RepID=A0A9P8TQS8_WICPI|nr:hypothetical protein WICPIJ_001388 [Wickerhamomyces pijperi]
MVIVEGDVVRNDSGLFGMTGPFDFLTDVPVAAGVKFFGVGFSVLEGVLDLEVTGVFPLDGCRTISELKPGGSFLGCGTGGGLIDEVTLDTLAVLSPLGAGGGGGTEDELYWPPAEETAEVAVVEVSDGIGFGDDLLDEEDRELAVFDLSGRAGLKFDSIAFGFVTSIKEAFPSLSPNLIWLEVHTGFLVVSERVPPLNLSGQLVELDQLFEIATRRTLVNQLTNLSGFQVQTVVQITQPEDNVVIIYLPTSLELDPVQDAAEIVVSLLDVVRTSSQVSIHKAEVRGPIVESDGHGTFITGHTTQTCFLESTFNSLDIVDVFRLDKEKNNQRRHLFSSEHDVLAVKLVKTVQHFIGPELSLGIISVQDRSCGQLNDFLETQHHDVWLELVPNRIQPV